MSLLRNMKDRSRMLVYEVSAALLISVVAASAQCPVCPTPNPNCTQAIAGHPTQLQNLCLYPRLQQGCNTPGWQLSQVGGGPCCVSVASPIIINVDGSGFQLTSADDGVPFDFFDDVEPLQISWTAPRSSNAWLVLDRDRDGLIDNGTELFGNLTLQPAPPPGVQQNGFLALAEFESGERWKRGQYYRQPRLVYRRLRLWQDKNHDGISSADELRPLPEFGVAGISLHYEEARRTDQYGNQFRYRAKILREDGSHDGRWAYDVFLLSGQVAQKSK